MTVPQATRAARQQALSPFLERSWLSDTHGALSISGNAVSGDLQVIRWAKCGDADTWVHERTLRFHDNRLYLETSVAASSAQEKGSRPGPDQGQIGTSVKTSSG